MRVLILAGKTPRPGTIFHEVQVLSGMRGLDAIIEWRDPLGAIEAGGFDLLMHRGLALDTLARLALVTIAQGIDRLVINPPSACFPPWIGPR